MLGLNVTIDTSITTPDSSVDHGIILSEGDGTVNLLSLGYMCNKGWKMKRYNPAGAQIIVREMAHEPDRFSPRGGPNTGDHVDILGRTSLNELILKIAAGQGDEIEDEIVSEIVDYANKVEIYDEGETPESRRKELAAASDEKLEEEMRRMELVKNVIEEVTEKATGKGL